MNDRDTYGIYTEESGKIILAGTDTQDERSEYAVRPGTCSIAAGAFENQPNLERLIIPASLEEIPDGALSNGEGWASEKKGISEIVTEPGNRAFVMSGKCFCRKLPDGSLKLIRMTGKDEDPAVPADVSAIAEKAFSDCTVRSVYLEGPGAVIWFPRDHAFYLAKLLAGFGRNGRLYDFSEYDRFLCGDHFNPQRIKMIRGRVCDNYDISQETADRLRENMRLHEDGVMEAVVESGSEDTLQDLADTGFFTEENIDRCIEQVNRSERKELLAWMMNYKNDHFRDAEFDFSI